MSAPPAGARLRVDRAGRLCAGDEGVGDLHRPPPAALGAQAAAAVPATDHLSCRPGRTGCRAIAGRGTVGRGADRGADRGASDGPSGRRRSGGHLRSGWRRPAARLSSKPVYFRFLTRQRGRRGSPGW